jgi:hypothetical protein
MSICPVHHAMDHPGLLVEALVDMLLEMFSILLMQVIIMILLLEMFLILLMHNFADAGGDEDTQVSRTGRVHVYNSSVDPNQVKPFRILKVDVQFSMAPLLKSIAEKWSPIESM